MLGLQGRPRWVDRTDGGANMQHCMLGISHQAEQADKADILDSLINEPCYIELVVQFTAV